MSDNISYIGKAGDDPDNVLRQCIGEFQEVTVIARLKDGTLELRSSMPDLEKIMWDITKIRHKALNGDYSYE